MEISSTSSAAVPGEEELQEDLGTITTYYRESLQLVLRGLLGVYREKREENDGRKTNLLSCFNFQFCSFIGINNHFTFIKVTY